MKLTISFTLGRRSRPRRRRRERPETPTGYTARTGIPTEGQTVEETTAALAVYASRNRPRVTLTGR